MEVSFKLSEVSNCSAFLSLVKRKQASIKGSCVCECGNGAAVRVFWESVYRW